MNSKCENCKCKELCGRIIQAGATGISCQELINIVSKIKKECK